MLQIVIFGRRARSSSGRLSSRLPMPTIVQTAAGKVTALWGHAVIRGANGRMRPLLIGDGVHRGDVILTTQDGIVQISDDEGTRRVATRLPENDIDPAITAINDCDAQAAPAAVIGGGG